ncbi:signal recognition particle, SRP9/SRP14 subunit [Cladorrhinum samala]|uniref:Signal recognition particle subunit SRP14 n=1 Tax=Cladorrhinum samala TaxID=585594 RepID=A0AAV9HU40_9PEZI|nr:signal recognition particle, SRP9/SRP14 subunit [Cladorrhinum samala]
MGHLTHDEFFTSLTSLFTTSKSSPKGSIILTQKRLSYNQPTPQPSESNDTFPDLNLASPLPLIIHATNAKSKEDRKAGKKIRLSTVVNPDDLEGFYSRYAEVCRAGMAGLKPRDRTKRKAKAKGRKKKGAVAAA